MVASLGQVTAALQFRTVSAFLARSGPDCPAAVLSNGFSPPPALAPCLYAHDSTDDTCASAPLVQAQMLATLLLVASVGLASADTAITLTLSGATNGTTSPVLGVNLGTCPAEPCSGLAPVAEVALRGCLFQASACREQLGSYTVCLSLPGDSSPQPLCRSAL